MAEDTSPAPGFGFAGRSFLAFVIIVGLAALSASLRELHSQAVGYQWYLLAALTLVSGSATVKLPSVPASISVSETFVFASVLLFGPAAGTATVALDGLAISFWMAKRRPEWYRPLFNMSAPAISIWCAGQVLSKAGGIEPLFHQPVAIDRLLIPLVMFASVYFALTSALIALAVGFEARAAPFRIWRDSSLLLSINTFSGASVALLLVVYTRDVDLRFIGIIIPLLLVLHFTFKTSLARVQDANSHLEQVNRMYLSTIETLAMAIDAKDHTTHGHIRRVQTVAVGLAHRIGVTDPTLLKAIEASALLHDMGKLVVPEHILNKPGRLSLAEFEKMKLHASVGADILTAIDFPYPVVPIVRHHHENWDGTGYPGGLRGTDIPIGARILAVVDCFDALTSDRPYRLRLNNGEALAILVERRGKMYDPLIVDTFVRVHEEIALAVRRSDPTPEALDEIGTFTSPVRSESDGADDIAGGREETSTLYALARELADQASPNDIFDVIAGYLRRMTPSSLCILYLYDTTTDELVARHAAGEAAPFVKGLRIEPGRRLTGWVAANRQTIVNSDANLDLGEAARAARPGLRGSVSCPMVWNDQLVGVLTLYSSTADVYSDSHRRITEAVAHLVAFALTRAVDIEAVGRRDGMDRLAFASHVEAAPPPRDRFR